MESNKRVRVDFTSEEVKVLKKAWKEGMQFAGTKTKKKIEKVASQLNISKERVERWIGNRRAKKRKTGMVPARKRPGALRGQNAYSYFAGTISKGSMDGTTYLKKVSREWHKLGENEKERYATEAAALRRDPLKGHSRKVVVMSQLKIVNEACQILSSLGYEMGGLGYDPSGECNSTQFYTPAVSGFFTESLQERFNTCSSGKQVVRNTEKHPRKQLRTLVRQHFQSSWGLDPSGYRHQIQHQQNDDDDDALLGSVAISDDEKYKDCERLKFKCCVETCGRENILDSPCVGADVHLNPSLMECQNPACRSRLYENITQLMNTLVGRIRGHVQQYYQGWLKCEDSACNTRVQKLPLMFQRGHPVCPVCRRAVMNVEYTDHMLYTQLCFYQYLFDLDRATVPLTGKEKERMTYLEQPVKDVYTQLKRVTDQWLKRNAYCEVNLNRLFEGLGPLK